MSFDLGVWYPQKRISNQQASELYGRLCDGDTSGVVPHAEIDAFYAELTARYPEIDTIPEEKVGDFDYCPWNCSLDRSPAHVIMSCVWSQATNVAEFVESLARKHGLAIFDPQSDKVFYPDGSGGAKRVTVRGVGWLLAAFTLLFAGVLLLHSEEIAPSRTPVVIYLLAGVCALAAVACLRQALRSG